MTPPTTATLSVALLSAGLCHLPLLPWTWCPRDSMIHFTVFLISSHLLQFHLEIKLPCLFPCCLIHTAVYSCSPAPSLSLSLLFPFSSLLSLLIHDCYLLTVHHSLHVHPGSLQFFLHANVLIWLRKFTCLIWHLVGLSFVVYLSAANLYSNATP